MTILSDDIIDDSHNGRESVLKDLRCPRDCDKGSVIIIGVIGHIVIQCATCQLSTPVLPLREAVKWWRAFR